MNKAITTLFIILMIGVHVGLANNLTVSSPVLVSRNQTSGTVNVQFNVSWDNSWRTSSAPNNWDAAWLFVKYKVGTGDWQHATLSATSTDHTAPAGSTISTVTDGKGVFIYRDADGSGSNSFNNVKLQWKYNTDGVAADAEVTVKVFGIEMVYVPTGSFYVGSGGAEEGTFSNGSAKTGNSVPLLIGSENAVTIDSTAGNLWYIPGSVFDGSVGSVGTLPAAYPKGYQGFYCMKYSVTQEEYVDFLNTLTYDQQTTRTLNAPNSTAGTWALATGAPDRNGIVIETPGTASSVPAVYACDLNGNTTYNEAADGQNISCNQLGWADGIAYSDWAGLRPMSELEFEKACRGTLTPVQYENAWGSVTITSAAALTNSGQPNEAVSTSGANANYNSGIGAPIRAGIFAGGSTTREQAGATYYGIMGMSGDLWERTVSVNNAGRLFTGSEGDGVLNASGDETGNTDWPGTSGSGAGFRGGTWDSGANLLQVSNRYVGTLTASTRSNTRGFRSVRTAP